MTERAAVIELLRLVVEMAREYWDDLGEPYPPNLQAAIDFLNEQEKTPPPSTSG